MVVFFGDRLPDLPALLLTGPGNRVPPLSRIVDLPVLILFLPLPVDCKVVPGTDLFLLPIVMLRIVFH